MKKILSRILTIFSLTRKLLAGSFLPTYWLLRKIPAYRRLPIYAQKLLSILLIIGVLSSSLYLYLYLFPSRAQAAWFDDSWSYRKAITATVTTNASDISNLQTLLTVDTDDFITAGKLQSSCQDLRFTNANGKLLPYYIDSACNGNSTKVWVMADLVPKNATTYTIYMYYGNPSAPAGTNSVKFDNLVGLKGYWTMNDGGSSATATDSSVTGDTGTLSATPAGTNTTATQMWTQGATGQYGASMGFDGTDDYVNAPTISIATSVTAEAWVYSTNYATNMFVVQKAPVNAEWELFFEGSLKWRGGSATTISCTAPSNSAWHHVVGTQTGTTATLYIDGVQCATGAVTAIPNGSGTIDIGRHSSAGYFFSGKIDDVKIYNTARTAAQILADYNNTSCGGLTCTINSTAVGTITPSTSFASEEKGTAPVAYWKFDEGQGVIANNSQYKSNSTMTNLLINPSFETGVFTSSWTCPSNGGNSTCAVDSTTSTFGTYNAKVTTGADTVTSHQLSNIAGGTITTTALTAYTASAWVKGTSGQIVTVEVRGAGGTALTNYTASVTLDGSWQRLTVSPTTLAAGDGSTAVYIYYGNNTNTGVTYYDGIQFESGSTANNYCDGSLTGNGTRSWSGTAHASTSTCSNGTDGMISSATWQTEDQCIAGKCLFFDGTDDAVTTADINDLDGIAAMTVSAWIKMPTLALNKAIITKWDHATQDSWALQTGDASTDELNVYVASSVTDSGVNYVRSTNADLAANTWYYVTFVYDGSLAAASRIKIYVNGVEKSTSVIGTVSTTLTSASSTVKIGRFGGSLTRYWNGHIDEPKIYNFALTAAQVKANYVAKTTGDGASAVFGSDTLHQNLSNGLVGYWKMDETATPAVDSSGNSNSGTWTGNATNAAGKFGNAISLDGTGDYVTVADSSSLDTTNVTTSLWAYVNPADAAIDADGGVFMDKTALTGGNTQYFMMFDDRAGIATNAIRAQTGTGGTILVDNVFSSATWYHIVFTFNDTDDLGIVYINGAEVGRSTTASVPAANALALRLGISTSDTFAFSGKLDEARVYNRALSPAEVSQLYNFAPGPVGYWKMEEGSGTSAFDSSTNANTGTITAGTGSYSIGKYGKGYSFDAANTIINAGSGTTLDDLPASGMTVEAWIYPKSIGENSAGFIINKNVGTSQNAGWLLLIQGTNTVQFVVDGSTDLVRTTSNSTITLNTWNHVVLSWDGVITTAATADIYVNGKEASYQTTTDGASRVSDATSSLYIGNDSTQARTFDGYIDEAKVYNYARSGKQIVEDMNAGHPAPGSPVSSATLYYKLDEGYSTVAYDSGSNLDNGNLTDGPTWTQAGKFGKALTLDGLNDHIEDIVSGPFEYTTGDMSASIWFKLNASDTDGGRIISKPWNGSGEYNYRLEVRSDETIGLVMDGTGTGATIAATTMVISSGTWYHMSFTIEEATKTARIYIDGIQRASGVHSFASMSPDLGDGNVELSIGCLYPYGSGWAGNTSYCVQGEIDEPKVYMGTLLTADQIKLDMNRGASQVLGALSDDATYQANAAAQEYCVPGDTASVCDGTDAPVGRWDFEEGTGSPFYDTSGNENSGTSAGTSRTSGKIGKGRLFNGTSDEISVADSTSTDVADAFTIEAWVKRTSTQGATQDVVASATVGSFILRFNTTNNIAIVKRNTGEIAASTNTVTDTAWHHLAWTKSGATNKIFYDGRDVTGTVTDSTIGNSGVFYFGSAGATNFFPGSLDGVRLFAYARTPAQIAWDYNKGGPVGWWKFDECQGTTANDSSGNSNSGTITIGGTGTYTSAGTCPSGTATHAWAGGVAGAGKRNYALSFDGTDDYVTMGDPASGILDFGTGDFSLSAWVKTTDSSGIIMSKYTGSAGWDWRVEGGLIFVLQDAGGSVESSAQGSTVANGSWHHVVVSVTRSGNAVQYLDGVQVGTLDVSARTATVSNSDTFRVGVRSSGIGYLVGQVDDPKAYNYALTATQAKILYNDTAVRYSPVTGSP